MTFTEYIRLGVLAQIALSTGVILYLSYASWPTPLRTGTLFTSVSYMIKAALIAFLVVHHWTMPFNLLSWCAFFAYITGDAGLLLMIIYFMRYKAHLALVMETELPPIRALLKGEAQGGPSGA